MRDQQQDRGPSSDDPRSSDASGGRSGDDDALEAPDTDGPVVDGEQVTEVGSSVTVDDLFELLAQPGNRYTLAYVLRVEGTVPYEDLVEYVVDESGAPEGRSTDDFRTRVATSLVHSHLPKLDDADLVDYDPDAGTVSSTDATAVAVPYLELAMEQFPSE